jgi:uncharacterized protein YkwD
VCELNAARESAGRVPLHARPSLGDAAAGHSADMVARGFFAHASPEGDGPADRAHRAGYLRRAAEWRIGEVLVWRSGAPLTAAAAVEAWLASPPHRRVLLGRHYRDVGAGVVAGAPFGDPGVIPASTASVLLGSRRS